MTSVEQLLQVVVYRRGDTVRHKATGNEFVVDHVQVQGYALTVAATNGARFADKDVAKVMPG